MRVGTRPSLLLAWAALASAADAPASGPAAPEGDRPIPIALRSERATAMYRVQGEASLDRQVGDGFALAGHRVAARRDDQGRLELDLAGDGTFKPARGGALVVALGDKAAKRRDKLEIFLAQQPDGAWTYRVITQLAGQVGEERFAVIDADGDGTFATPGADALAFAGSTYAFPLPRPDERWCTERLELTGLSFGPRGEEPKVVGRPLATTVPEALPVLRGIIGERLRYGLVPRPEDPALSAPLQKHCRYMLGTGVLAHPEDPSVPGYSPDGHEAGMASILGNGMGAETLARGMVATFYHRQDVVRPGTAGFGVGYAGRFGGIDGRRRMGAPETWPILIPPPEAADVALRFGHESPDPIAGDREAGFPITAYFAGGPLKLTESRLELFDAKGAREVECYRFDAEQGGEVGFNRFQHVVGLIAKDPLAGASRYRVTLAVETPAGPWTRTWIFATAGAAADDGPGRRRDRR